MTPDQEKELQKAAEDWKSKQDFELELTGNLGNYPSPIDCFIAGAKHQDAISRKDEREKIITLFQDKLDMLDIYSFEKRGWEILRNVFKQILEESIK